MAFIGYERASAPATEVHNAGHLTIPPATQRAQLQATGANVRYTMDGSATPATDRGMLLVANAVPEWFEREDLANIRFIGAAVGAFLNLHWYGSRLP